MELPYKFFSQGLSKLFTVFALASIRYRKCHGVVGDNKTKRQKGKQVKRQKGKKAKRQKGKNTKRLTLGRRPEGPPHPPQELEQGGHRPPKF